VLRCYLRLGNSLLLVDLFFVLNVAVLDNVILLVLRQIAHSLRVVVAFVDFVL
jgi:hypothetical protein